jgi:pilus assembly protein CpaF
MAWDVIIPFLRPIEPYLRDADVSDILVNGSRGVFVEKDGRLQRIAGVSVSEKALQVAVRNIARVLGDDISEEQPLLDARLPDGSRVAAVFPPCSVNGTTLAIRKFQSKKYDGEELVRVGTMTREVLELLRRAVEGQQNILVAGRTGSGKTTLLNALTSFISADERVIVIEDTSEIQIDIENLVRLEARRAQPGLPAVTQRDLLRASLRLRPDRILLGEVRGGEAFDLLQAMNTGHSGTLSTLHANSARAILPRLSSCVLQADVNLPYRSIRSQIAECVHILVYLDRRHGKRRVIEMLAVRGYDPDSDSYALDTIYAA